ncbi:MAG: hypothetical protein AAGI71_15175 [Bacteroidota bacterium]
MATVHDSTTIEEQLRALVHVQHIDSRIDQLEKMRGDLPEEISDLEDEKAGLETRVENAKQEAKEREVGRRQAELDIREAEGLIKKYEEQQLQVRNNREYDALTKEIEAQKQRMIQAQGRIDEVDNTADSHAAIIVDSEQRLADLDGILAAKKKELEDVLEETRQEQEGLRTKSDEARQEVDARYLRAYDRLRSRMRDGRAVVPLVRGAASGYAVPPQRQVEIRQRNRIVVCEHTGRIIVDEDLYVEIGDKVGA